MLPRNAAIRTRTTPAKKPGPRSTDHEPARVPPLAAEDSRPIALGSQEVRPTMTIDPTPSPRMVRFGLLAVFVREVARAAERGDIGGSARRLALELARALTWHEDAIALDAVRDAVFGHAVDDARSINLANAFAELAHAGLVVTRASQGAVAPLCVSSIELLVPMRRGRYVEGIHVHAVRAIDLLEPRVIAVWDEDAAPVRARIAGRRGRVVELPEEVLGA